MPALALTDHGVMFGAIDFYVKARELGIKPIIGCEMYVSGSPLEEKAGPGSKTYHLGLLAENEVGYRNLIQLTTEAHLRGFYRKPRIDHALLEKHSEGLICLSGCASSELAKAIVEDNLRVAEELADWHQQIFPGRYYLELQYHDLEVQTKINQGIIHLSRKLELPLVATNDVHYVRSSQAKAHEVLLCVQTQTNMADPKRMRMETQEFYLKSPEQMATLFGEYPSALSNTLEIAERCNLELDFGRPQLPDFPTPKGRTSEEHLRVLCEEGLHVRYPDADPDVISRLEYELSIIDSTGFVDYFLLVHDVIHFARAHGIPVGPGRGSAAGSIVAYCLFITSVDPIRHGLSFERFLNPERVTMPDMDLDFADDRRDELIRYVTNKYGRDRVAQIITFGTMGVKAGVRDVGRALGMSYGEVDRVAKLVPQVTSTVDKAMEEAPELQALYEEDPEIAKLLDTVRELEGVARHASTHAAGVLISRDPLAQHVPLYKVPKSEQISSQYAMGAIEKIGLLKLDFLGLRTLTILQRACRFVKATTGKEIDLDAISLEDPSIYVLLNAGETFGVFQVDKGMRNQIKNLHPEEFNHIMALISLYRPGPMQYIDRFCDRKNGRLPVEYKHPDLEEALRETYGIIVYQEQVMRMLNLLAGYTLGEADLVRRAMAKKKADQLALEKERFQERAVARGLSEQLAAELFSDIEPFAGYAFPKAHGAAYAVLTCQTAYMKANYPTEFMCGLLSAEKENADKVSEAMAECRHLGISVLPPDLNSSELDFTIEDGKIRFGLSAVKNVGTAAVECIVETRRAGGPFPNLEDLSARLDWTVVGKRALESLAKCGALDSFGFERGRLVSAVERIVAVGTQMQRAAAAGQTSLFGDVADSPVTLQLPTVQQAATLEEKISWEEELIGIAVTQHPFIGAIERLREHHVVPPVDISADNDGEKVLVGGIIRGLRSFPTKDGRMMARFQLSDLASSIDAVVFNRSYQQVRVRLVEGTSVVASGTISASDGRLQVLVDALSSLEEAESLPPPANGNGRRNGHSESHARAKTGEPRKVDDSSDGPKRIRLRFKRSGDRAADLDRLEALYAALQQRSGIDEVEIAIDGAGGDLNIQLPNRYTDFSRELLSEVSAFVDISEASIDGSPVPR
jgi:DNA polymerase-3 subunit alpha